MSEYYEPAELRALSGYKHQSRQIRWLREQHIPYLLDKDGRPKVLRATVAAASGCSTRAGIGGTRTGLSTMDSRQPESAQAYQTLRCTTYGPCLGRMPRRRGLTRPNC